MNGVEQFLSFFPRGDSDSRLIKCAEDEKFWSELFVCAQARFPARCPVEDETQHGRDDGVPT